jgi:signal transduction histidine kinase
MLAYLRARIVDAWRLIAHSLSGRLLLLTIFYVLLTEVLILVPSLGRYHRSLLESHIESAEIAILPFTEAGGEALSQGLRHQLLARAGADAVMLRRADQRELFLAHDEPTHFELTIDLRDRSLFAQMVEALDCLMQGRRTLHVIAATQIRGAQAVEVIVGEAPIRAALVGYADRLVLLGLLISLATAFLVFASLYLVFVRPMRRLTFAMLRFREDPEDASRIVATSSRKDEIGVAQRELAAMQRDIFGFLQQKARLAALGSAVAKIQHDLRNILASAQLASDRLASVDDPVVQRLTPRLFAALDRAIRLATNTLRFGRADEHPPERRRIRLLPIVTEAFETATAGNAAMFAGEVDAALEIDADPEQLFRILLNLLRNAAEALRERTDGEIRVRAERRGPHVAIDIADNGAGIPDSMREKLFRPFAPSARAGGSGLGLAIARDLARAHGGDVTLVSTGAGGSRFRIDIPDRKDG